MAAGVAPRQPVLLFCLAAIALIGGLLPRHPFDYLYELTLHPLLAAPPLPPQPAPRRFACKLASVWLVATAVAFLVGPAALGYELGGVLVAVAAVVSTTNWCLPSLIYALAGRLLARAVAAPSSDAHP